MAKLEYRKRRRSKIYFFDFARLLSPKRSDDGQASLRRVLVLKNTDASDRVALSILTGFDCQPSIRGQDRKLAFPRRVAVLIIDVVEVGKHRIAAIVDEETVAGEIVEPASVRSSPAIVDQIFRKRQFHWLPLRNDASVELSE